MGSGNGKLEAVPHTICVAVDYGTSSSTIAVYDHTTGRATAIPVPRDTTLPSTVAYDRTQESWRVGKDIPGQPVRFVKVISGAKRVIGLTGRGGLKKMEVGCWTAVLTGAILRDVDGYDEQLRGVRVQRMIERASEVLLGSSRPPEHAESGSVNPSVASAGVATIADAEGEAIDKGLTHLFRSILARHEPKAAETDAGGAVEAETNTQVGSPTEFEQLAAAAKVIYGRNDDIPEVETLICEHFGITAAAFIDDLVLYPPVVAAAVIHELLWFLWKIHPDIKFSCPSTAGHGVQQPHEVVTAVMTVPAYATARQREMTRLAGRIAGLGEVTLVNEPSAAAVAYVMQIQPNTGDGYVFICDCGAGTLDFSAVDVQTEIVQPGDGKPSKIASVMATEGDDSLGGEHITEAIMKIFCRKLKAEVEAGNVEAQKLDEIRESGELWKAAETTKEKLEPGGRWVSTLCGVDLPVSYEEYEEETKPIFEKIESCGRRFLDQLGSHAISNVVACVIVGAGGLAPGFLEAVERIFSELQLRVVLSPESRTLAAIGAAYISVGAVFVNDRTSLRVGIEAHSCVKPGVKGDSIEAHVAQETSPNGDGDGVDDGIKGQPKQRLPMVTILPRNSPYQLVQTKNFTNYEDDQTSQVISVYEGEHPIAEENTLLGEFEITGLSKAPKGELDIRVSMSANENGQVEVTAEEVSGRGPVTRVVEQKAAISEQEVRGMQEFFDQKFNKGQPQENKPRDGQHQRQDGKRHKKQVKGKPKKRKVGE